MVKFSVPGLWAARLVFILVLGGLSGAAVGSNATPSDPGLTVDQEYSVFFDRIVPQQLARHHIPGAVVIVVKEGRVVFARGYGYADPIAGEPMDPWRTVVRVGSLSKIPVWIAVMQGVAEGRLGLDDDINLYLGREGVEDTFPGRPVTLRHLMTHTGGFEDRITGVFARDRESLLPLDQALDRGLPRRIRPPGEIFAYSNHGAALAARVIEIVYATPFETYAEEQILVPLGMKNSTFRQPPPPGLIERLSGGFRYTGKGYEKMDFEYVALAPSGGLSATAGDIGNLLVCLLNDGEISGRRVVDGRVIRGLLDVRFSPDPRIAGWRGGLMEMYHDGRYALWHGGDIHHSSCLLALFPDDHCGFFIAYNSGEGSGPAREVLLGFTGLVRPSPESISREGSASLETGNRSASISKGIFGRYLSTRSPAASYEKVFLLAPGSDYYLEVRDLPGQEVSIREERFKEVLPGVFARRNGEIGAVIVTTGSNGMQYLIMSDQLDAAFAKVEWYDDPEILSFLLVICQGIFLSLPLTWAASVVLPEGSITQRSLSPVHLFFSVLSSLSTIFVLLLFSVLRTGEVFFGVPPLLPLVLILPPAIVALTGTAVALTMAAVFMRWGNRRDRTEWALITIAAVFFSWWIFSWHLLGPDP